MKYIGKSETGGSVFAVGKAVQANLPEGARVSYEGETGTVQYTNDLDRKACYLKVKLDGESSVRNMNASSLERAK